MVFSLREIQKLVGEDDRQFDFGLTNLFAQNFLFPKSFSNRFSSDYLSFPKNLNEAT